MSSVSSLSRLAVAIALGVSMQAAQAEEEAKELGTVTVVGDWLGEADQAVVQNHPGARSVVRRREMLESGAQNVRDVLRKVPGVQVQDNNGTGGSDISLNVGVRGLTSRLSPRSTVMIDGVPAAVAPYGQPQLSMMPLSIGNLESIDVVRGAGSVRYGPQNVGGVINFVTRAIPEKFSGEIGTTIEHAGHGGWKKLNQAFLGGTADNGLGVALLYSGVKGADYRDGNNDNDIDDVLLKTHWQLTDSDQLAANFHYYDAYADMPGGLTQAQYDDDPFQSVRDWDNFRGRRKDFSLKYTRQVDDLTQFEVLTYYSDSFRGSSIAARNLRTITSYPRDYHVFAVEPRVSRIFFAGPTTQEVGIGYRYLKEAMNERASQLALVDNVPTVRPGSDGHTYQDRTGGTEASAFYIDDKIDVGNWTITPGIRYEKIDSEQKNLLKNSKDSGRYNASLPALNVIYHLTPSWNLYANTEGSFGTVQYSQMGKAVRSGDIEPEKARTWELGSRYDDGILRAELGAFLINFDNQYESNQQTDSVTARGKTRHKGIEAAIAYDLADLDPLLSGFDVYASYAYVDASIREDGPNKGNQVPFSSKHKGTLGANYRTGAWSYNLDGSFQTSQYADNANTESESADGSTGRIAGWMVWSARGTYDFGPQLNDLKLGLGVKNLFDRRYYTRSFDDNNKGLYVGQPRTLYVQASVGF